MKVLFHNKTLNYRGVTNSIVDYAKYNREILGNESDLIYSSNFKEEGLDTGSKQEVVDNLKQSYNVLTYDNETHLNKIAEKYDVVYTQKAGHFDDDFVTSTKTAIHAVFQYYQPHGDSYAYISEWLAKEMNQLCPEDTLKWVPYIVNMPIIQPGMRETIRDILKIPQDAFVIGRHGGMHTFDLPFVINKLPNICNLYPNVYFLLANTRKTVEHPHIIYSDPFFGEHEKTIFVSACDAGLHGRELGESFGASICDMLFHNKPVLAWEGGFDRNHVELLKGWDLLYNEYNITQKVYEMMHRKQCNYKETVEPFSPANVMARFQQIFLDN